MEFGPPKWLSLGKKKKNNNNNNNNNKTTKQNKTCFMGATDPNFPF